MKVSTHYCDRCEKEIKIVYCKPDKDLEWRYDILKFNLKAPEHALHMYSYAVHQGYITQLELCDDCKKSFMKWLSNEKPCIDEEASSWINVNDRLPDYEGDYLVTDGHKTPWKCRLMSLAGIKGWSNNALNPTVKYWMPLPELPKEKDSDSSHPFADDVVMDLEEE